MVIMQAVCRAMLQHVKTGWMSANDYREMEDMNMIPDEDGGNLYLVNGSFTKLADAGAFANQNPIKEEETE